METGPRIKSGHTIAAVRSVASFFVSRVDVAVDSALEKIGHNEFAGKIAIAIANAKIAYSRFQVIFGGERWDSLSTAGAAAQRLLWASTGTKNHSYPEPCMSISSSAGIPLTPCRLLR